MKKLTLSTKPDFALSQLVLGFWRMNDIPAQQIIDIIHYALDRGITSFDEADIYGGYRSQEYMGRALKAEPSLRDKIEIITKTGIILPDSKFTKSGIGYYKTTDAHIMQSVEQSLLSLNTSYIDLLLIHRPDILMIPEELDRTFQNLKKSGKVLHFGVSNFTPQQFEMLSARMETPLLTNQIEFSVLHTAPVFDGTFDHCMKNRIKPMIWSPLAGGALFTKKTEQIHRVTGVLAEIAKEHNNAGIDQIALAWILKHPVNTLLITGTLKPDRIREAVNALSIDLTEEQWYQILIASQGHPMA